MLEHFWGFWCNFTQIKVLKTSVSKQEPFSIKTIPESLWHTSGRTWEYSALLSFWQEMMGPCHRKCLPPQQIFHSPVGPQPPLPSSFPPSNQTHRRCSFCSPDFQDKRTVFTDTDTFINMLRPLQPPPRLSMSMKNRHIENGVYYLSKICAVKVAKMITYYGFNEQGRWSSQSHEINAWTKSSHSTTSTVCSCCFCSAPGICSKG